jgi:hypothetical protein
MQQTAALIALLAIASVMVNAGDFVQLLCTGASCNSGCSYQTFPEHRCLSMAEGQSGIASCDTTRGVLMVKNFYLSPNCSGASETTQQTLGQCYPTVAGSFVEYLCDSPSDKKHDFNKRKHDDEHHHHHHGMGAKIESLVGMMKDTLRKPPVKQRDAEHTPLTGANGILFVVPRRH